jgi:ferredoxin-NADP reductase
VSQKLACVVERVIAHGDRVYSLVLRPERPLPRFRAGQFLHLALDRYDPTGFWPESRVFSIASPPADRQSVRITYAVKGHFTTRMEMEAVEGRELWVKLPYGDFVVDPGADVALFAGGTGVTAFTAFLEALRPETPQRVALAYGARTGDLLIYRDVVERCAARVPALSVTYVVGEPLSPDTLWRSLRQPEATHYYISGPPAMLRGLGDALRTRGIAPEAIHVDAWE